MTKEEIADLQRKLFVGMSDPIKTTVTDGQVTTNQDILGMAQAYKIMRDIAREDAAEEAANSPGSYAPVRLHPGC